jgi:hypothetical protein
MIAANNVGAAPIDGFFVFNVKKYPRNKRTAADNETPHAVDVLKPCFFTRQVVQYGPNQQEKKGHAIPIKIRVYSFNDDFHGHQK